MHELQDSNETVQVATEIDRILGSDAARAVGRFRPEGPTGYRAKSDPAAPLRATRAEAEADERAHLEGNI